MRYWSLYRSITKQLTETPQNTFLNGRRRRPGCLLETGYPTSWPTYKINAHTAPNQSIWLTEWNSGLRDARREILTLAVKVLMYASFYWQPKIPEAIITDPNAESLIEMTRQAYSAVSFRSWSGDIWHHGTICQELSVSKQSKSPVKAAFMWSWSKGT